MLLLLLTFYKANDQLDEVHVQSICVVAFDRLLQVVQSDSSSFVGGEVIRPSRDDNKTFDELHIM